MDKTQILSLIREKLQDGTISESDLQNVAHAAPDMRHASGSSNHITNIFYIIGAIIAVAGAVLLVGQNWEEIGFFGRAVVTMGIAIATYTGAVLMRGPHQRVLSQVFFAISAVLAPIGIAVFIRQFGLTFGPYFHVCMGLALGSTFLAAFWQVRRNILVLLGLAYYSWAYLALVAALFDVTATVGKWAFMVLGASYLLVAYYYHANRLSEGSAEAREKRAVEGLIYGIGTSSILCPALFFNGLFDLVTLALLFAAFYLSVFVKSRIVLLAASGFFMIYIVKVTWKYFEDSISWPLALIVVGFLVIAVGYGTFYLNRKFLSK